MIIIDSERVAFFDVDDTLVMWEGLGEPVVFDYYGTPESLVPHEGHVRLLKAQKKRGYTVVVWSQGGYQWALEVVTQLGLTEYVSMVMTKPACYTDDLDASEWMGKRIYLPVKETV